MMIMLPLPLSFEIVAPKAQKMLEGPFPLLTR